MALFPGNLGVAPLFLRPCTAFFFEPGGEMYLPVNENAVGGRVEAGRTGATMRAGKETGSHSGARRGGAWDHTEGGSGKAKAEGRRPSGGIAKGMAIEQPHPEGERGQ